MIKTIAIVVLSLICFCCCKKDEQEKKLVVQAYLYPYKPIFIKLSQLSPEFLSEIPVNDAVIQIRNNNSIYDLSNVKEKPGFYSYSGDELMIRENEKYILNISYQRINLYAETIVPAKPTNLSIEQGSLILPTKSKYSLRLTWNKNTDYSFITVDYIGNDSIKVPNTLLANNYIPYYLSTPYNYETVLISNFIFKYYGKYVIKVYSINEEYRKLYEYKKQYKYDSPAIETNIVNGLGIFTAMSYDSVIVQIKYPEK